MEPGAWVPSSNQTLCPPSRVTFWSPMFFLMGSHPSLLWDLSALWSSPWVCSEMPSTFSQLTTFHSLSLYSLLQASPLAYLHPNLFAYLSALSISFIGNVFIRNFEKCSFFLLSLSSKVTCFETLWPPPAHSYHSVIYLPLSSPPCRELHCLAQVCVLLCSYCCYYSNPPLNTTLIEIISALYPAALSLKHTVPRRLSPLLSLKQPGLAVVLNLLPPLCQFGVLY